MGFIDTITDVVDAPFDLVGLKGPGELSGVNDFLGDILGGGGSQSQEPLETPEQREARQKLLAFAKSGRFGQGSTAGEFTTGEDLGFNLTAGTETTDIEKAGLANLLSLVQGGGPQEFDLAGESLKNLLASSPEGIDRQFDPFKTRVEREIGERSDAAKRQAAFTSSLFGTDTIERLGDVQAKGTEFLAQKLADLENEQLDRSLQASLATTNLGIARQASDIDRIGASQQFGSLERLLEAAREGAKQSEALRKRREQFGRLDVLGQVSGEPGFGVREVEIPSMLDNLLNMGANVGGQILVNKFGK